MLSFMRDIPFIDTIAPIVLAAFLWAGLNILTIGPDVIAPRMTQNIWMPACKAGIQTANAKIQANHQAKINAFIAAKRAEQKKIQSMMNPLMQLMGKELAQTLGKGLTTTMSIASNIEANQELKQRFGTAQPQSVAPANYCGCIISELLQDRVATGLYSASMRLWKPANIQKLDGLGSTLITSNNCSN